MTLTLCVSPILLSAGILPISYFRLFLLALYLPPEGVTPTRPFCDKTIIVWRVNLFKNLSLCVSTEALN